MLADSGILYSVDLPGTAAQVTAAVRGLGLEGVIAKRRDSPYIPGERSSAWIKVKLDRQQELVIGGYRPGPHGIDALLVGYHESRRLRFAAKVRAGFTPRVRRDVHVQLISLHAGRCPFVDLPSGKTSHWGGGVTAEEMAEIQWVGRRSSRRSDSSSGRLTVTCVTRHSSGSARTNPPRKCGVNHDGRNRTGAATSCVAQAFRPDTPADHQATIYFLSSCSRREMRSVQRDSSVWTT